MSAVLAFGLIGCSNGSNSSPKETTVNVSLGGSSNAIEGEETSGSEKDIEILEAPLFFSAERGQAIFTVLLKNNSKNVASQVILSPIAKSSSGDLVGSTTSGRSWVNYVGPGETTAVSVELFGCDSKPASVDWNVKVPHWYKTNETNTYKPKIGATSIKTDSGNWTRAQAEVINDGETSFSSVFLVAVYKDASGNIIGSGAGGEGIDAGTSKIIETSATFPRDDLSVASTEFYVSWQL